MKNSFAALLFAASLISGCTSGAVTSGSTQTSVSNHATSFSDAMISLTHEPTIIVDETTGDRYRVWVFNEGFRGQAESDLQCERIYNDRSYRGILPGIMGPLLQATNRAIVDTVIPASCIAGRLATIPAMNIFTGTVDQAINNLSKLQIHPILYQGEQQSAYVIRDHANAGLITIIQTLP